MEQDSHRSNLNNQIREQFGKVTYSQTTHVKEAIILQNLDNRLKWASILLSVVTAGGIIGFFLTDVIECTIVSIISSLIMLVNSSILKEIDYPTRISAHKEAADSLWIVREKYLSLLVDFDSLSTEEIMRRRDELTEATGQIYSHVPATSKKSYKIAQQALKIDEEQYFSQEELNNMLPESLRKD